MGLKNEFEGFSCQRCGACCRWPGHVLLTDEDVIRMAEATGLSEIDFIERYTVLAANRRQLSLSEFSDGRCIFLKGDMCEIYESRPDQCRNFPHSWRVQEGCPALDEIDKSTLKR